MTNQLAPPEIQFCTSADGTRIAWGSWGSGPTVVINALYMGFALEGDRSHFSRHWIAEFSKKARVIWFDARGCGLSERQVVRSSLQAWVDDLDAVIRACGAGTVAMVALMHAGPLAIRYAATHPERVAKLVFVSGYARGRLRRNPTADEIKETHSQLEMAEVAFSTNLPYASAYRTAFVSRHFPQADQATWTALGDECVRHWTGAGVNSYALVNWELDVSDEVSRITSPVLILHARHGLAVPYEEGRRLAASLPGTRFVTYEGENQFPLENDAAWRPMCDEINAFLGLGGSDAPAGAASPSAAPTLTVRQLEVLRAIGQGHTDKEIARLLGLSPRTVEMHVARILAALDCPSRSAAVRKAAQQRLLD